MYTHISNTPSATRIEFSNDLIDHLKWKIGELIDIQVEGDYLYINPTTPSVDPEIVKLDRKVKVWRIRSQRADLKGIKSGVYKPVHCKFGLVLKVF